MYHSEERKKETVFNRQGPFLLNFLRSLQCSPPTSPVCPVHKCDLGVCVLCVSGVSDV